MGGDEVEMHGHVVVSVVVVEDGGSDGGDSGG
jgi:hypothetical protein